MFLISVYGRCNFFTFAKVQIISCDLNFPFFLAKRIIGSGKRTFSKFIVRVGVGAIAIGIAAMILAVAVLNGFKGEVTAKQRGFFGDVDVTKYNLNNSFENTPFYLRNDKLTELKALPGVTGIQRYATKAGIINVNGEVEGVVLKGIDEHYDQGFIASVLVAGKTIDFADSTQAMTQVIISGHTASRLLLDVGDAFVMYFVQEPIRRRKLEVVGIYNTSAEELDKVYIIGALSLIQRLNDWDEAEVGGYELSVSDFERVGDITEQINDILPLDVDAISLRDRFPEIFQWLDLLDGNPQIILILMMVVASINMISALLIIILERTSMIGVLKALGYTNGGLQQVFLYNAAYLIGLGLLIGNAIGLGLYFFQATTQYIKLDEASYYVSYVPVAISFWEIILLNIGVLVVSLLVLLIPSYLISRVSPVKAIQFR